MSPALDIARETFQSRHPSPIPPTTDDMRALQAISSLVSRRSASIVAASLFALWELKAEAEQAVDEDTDPITTSPAAAVVAFNGSVIENYPGYQAALQQYLDGLLAVKERGVAGPIGSIRLVEARESSLLGAAVALALGSS